MNKFIKRILGAATAVAVAFGSLGAVPDGVLPGFSVVASAVDFSGSGTESDPWILTDSNEFLWLEYNSRDGYYTITQDTTIAGIRMKNIHLIIPEGKTLTCNGQIIFDCDDSELTISGGGKLVVNKSGNDCIDMQFYSGTLNIINTEVECNTDKDGIFCGAQDKTGTINISGSKVTSSIKTETGTVLNITDGSTYSGVIVERISGNTYGTRTITNSTLDNATVASAAITNSTIKNSSTVTNSTVTGGTITGSTISGSTISGSTVTGGTITGSTIKENSTVDNTAVIKSTTVTNSTVGGKQVTNDTYDENGNTGYKVTFYKNDGTTDVYTTQTVKNDNSTKATAPTAPTRTGYTFKGWYTTSACTGTAFNFANTPITANTTLYAKWLQHITYIGADGEEQTVGDDEDYTPVTSDTTSWSGTMVVADNVTIGADSTPIMVNGDTNLIICEGKTLTLNRRIHLRDNNDTAHTLTLNGTGSLVVSVNDASGCFTGYSGSLIINNCNVTLTQNNLSSPANDETFYIILNSGNLSVSNPSSSSSKTIGKATITLNGGTLIASSYRIDPTGKVTIIVGTGKYYMDTTTGTLYTPDTYTTDTKGDNYIGNIDGHTLTPAYKVTFDAGDGQFADESNTLVKGVAATGSAKVTAPTAPKHATLFFAGWYTDESCTDGYKFDFSTAITADTTLYAKWAEITFTKVPAKAATCTAAGNKEYYKGSDNKYYTFADGVYTETTLAAVTIAKLGHNMTAHAAKDATCTTAGNTAYWYCDRCEKYFSDANGTNQIAEDSWVIPATGHTLTLIAEVPATCKDEGVKSHYKCTVCEKLFTDAQGENETTLAALTIAKLGHNYENGKCTRCGEADPDYKEPDNGGNGGGGNGGGGNGGGGYTPVIPSYPSGGGNTTNTTTDNSNEPKIEGGSGASGWSNIASEISKTPEGGSVTVDMAGTTTVPKSVLEAVKGKDVDLVLDMGEGIKWTINGKDVTDVSGSIDLGVTVGTSGIPVDVINNVTGERYNMVISLAHSGAFGFTATLTVNMRKQDAGLIANLFYYNPTTKALEFVSSGRIKADGTVDLEFGHASDYTIVVDDHELGKELTATVSRTGNVKLSWTAQDGAESYNVYRAIDGKWVKLGTTSKTTYTVKSLTNNKTYKFMVRAKIGGKLVAKADAMTLKVKVYYKPAPKATTADGRITLTWKEVPYATKYRIYVVKNGKYVKLKDTKKLTYSTSATVGKTYKFAVKAYVNGKWTSVKASDIIKIKAK